MYKGFLSLTEKFGLASRKEHPSANEKQDETGDTTMSGTTTEADTRSKTLSTEPQNDPDGAPPIETQNNPTTEPPQALAIPLTKGWKSKDWRATSMDATMEPGAKDLEAAETDVAAKDVKMNDSDATVDNEAKNVEMEDLRIDGSGGPTNGVFDPPADPVVPTSSGVSKRNFTTAATGDVAPKEAADGIDPEGVESATPVKGDVTAKEDVEDATVETATDVEVTRREEVAVDTKAYNVEAPSDVEAAIDGAATNEETVGRTAEDGRATNVDAAMDTGATKGEADADDEAEVERSREFPHPPVAPSGRAMTREEQKRHRDKIVLFTKVLMKHLEQKDQAVYKRAKEVRDGGFKQGNIHVCQTMANMCAKKWPV